MTGDLEELKERAQNPGEVFSRGEMLQVIKQVEHWHEKWSAESWARMGWKEDYGLAYGLLVRAVDLLHEVRANDSPYDLAISPVDLDKFFRELKRVMIFGGADRAPEED